MSALPLVLLVTIGAAPAAAQSPDELTLDETIRLVREESPAARALRARIVVADAEIDLAGVYPNPLLGYAGFGRLDGGNAAINGTQHQVWLDLPLLLGSQHDARRDVAAAAAIAARAEVELELLALEIDARSVFLELVVAQERARRLEAASTELAGLRSIVDARAGAGAQSRYDSARLGVEVARVDAELAVARADARTASALLGALLGRAGWSPRTSATLDAHARSYASTDDLPAVRAARARLDIAERDVARAERERIPEIRLALGAYFTTDGDSSSAYLGVAVPLPVFDTGEAAVRRARAVRAAASAERDAIEAFSRARLDAWVSTMEARRGALEAFDEETLSRLPELQQMAEASYRLGVSGIFELLDAFHARVELELARIDLARALVAAEIGILSVLGR